ncbi:Uncharacterised protein [Mycolicibacterium fortuitum]|uniref:Uncharacterized protein n=1 Tax=Mycolicibacterium fortuitum TaxID=1766 RepID=A0A378WCN2_MYCFO|nr:Uncharacterised protein [Mycolicibacterium fortuitum]
MNTPANIQNLGFAILGLVFFIVGIGIGCVTANNTMRAVKNSQDSMSIDAWKTLLAGGALTATFLTPSIYAIIRFGGAALNQFGF